MKLQLLFRTSFAGHTAACGMLLDIIRCLKQASKQGGLVPGSAHVNIMQIIMQFGAKSSLSALLSCGGPAFFAGHV
jgi:hypothetical protein